MPAANTKHTFAQLDIAASPLDGAVGMARWVNLDWVSMAWSDGAGGAVLVIDGQEHIVSLSLADLGLTLDATSQRVVIV